MKGSSKEPSSVQEYHLSPDTTAPTRRTVHFHRQKSQTLYFALWFNTDLLASSLVEGTHSNQDPGVSIQKYDVMP